MLTVTVEVIGWVGTVSMVDVETIPVEELIGSGEWVVVFASVIIVVASAILSVLPISPDDSEVDCVMSSTELDGKWVVFSASVIIVVVLVKLSILLISPDDSIFDCVVSSSELDCVEEDT